MIFIAFECHGGKTECFFVGTCREAILDGTEGGTRFGHGSFVSRRTATEDEVKGLRFGQFDILVASIRSTEDRERHEALYLGDRPKATSPATA